MKTLQIKDINQAKLARDTGADPGHLSRILSGQSNPSWPLARKLANALGISLDAFWDLLDLQELREIT